MFDGVAFTMALGMISFDACMHLDSITFAMKVLIVCASLDGFGSRILSYMSSERM
jgi:hypothetical protein